jgi:hypothetical protein
MGVARTRWRRWTRYAILFLCLLIGISAYAQEGSKSQQDLTVSGVIERLDTTKGMLKTPTGKPIFFDIVKPEAFKGITVGQHVTIQLDEQGRAIEAIPSQSIPDLPAPAPPQ